MLNMSPQIFRGSGGGGGNRFNSALMNIHFKATFFFSLSLHFIAFLANPELCVCVFARVCVLTHTLKRT